MLDARPGFGWSRLAEIYILNGTIHGDKTLQDYWRRNPGNSSSRPDEELEAAGELVRDADGKVWHLVHAPAELQSAKLELLTALITARLRRHARLKQTSIVILRRQMVGRN
jgi:hypothetical protein